jgi:hypothetical protein
MTEIDDVKKEMRKLEEIRSAFYALLDVSIPKDKNGNFDFSKEATIDAEDVYKNFFKLDYQARKIRGLLMEARDITPGG